jgi:hypothetical protein
LNVTPGLHDLREAALLSERDQAIVLDRARGDTYQQIAARFDLTHPRVMTIVQNAEQLALTMELDLRAARQDNEALDRATARQDHDMIEELGEYQQCAYVIPYSENYTVAMRFSDWLLGRLRKRGLKLKIETRRASNGIALLITDITDITGGER